MCQITALLYSILFLCFSFPSEHLTLEIPLNDDHYIHDENDDVIKESDRFKNDDNGIIMSEDNAHRKVGDYFIKDIN
ncbi:unnamed protein product [Trichobilharzia regenti]|nr:unnamed protein product [Trichobilharzia regenti]